MGEVCSTQLRRLLERVREEVGGGQSSLKDMLVSLGYRQTPEQPQTKLKAAKPLGDFWSPSTFNDGRSGL